MSKASIVLLTCNGEKYLEQVLQMIGRQKQPPLEVLAIDSSSNDSTPQILHKFLVPTKTIPRSEFSHPGTRNIATRMCSGEFIVFLTQDAVPADSCWLESLLRPFQETENVAGVFSKQIPRPGASLLEANDLRQDFPSQRTVKRFIPGETPDRKEFWNLIKFSNSSAAYQRSLLLSNPFLEQLEMAEDQEWAKRMLEQSFAIVYEPASVVVHSHQHYLREKYFRSLSMGRAFSSFLKSEIGNRSIQWELGAWLAHLYLDFRYILSTEAGFLEKLKWMVLSPVHRAAIHYAYRKGWNSSKISTRERKTFSRV